MKKTVYLVFFIIYQMVSFLFGLKGSEQVFRWHESRKCLATVGHDVRRTLQAHLISDLGNLSEFTCCLAISNCV